MSDKTFHVEIVTPQSQVFSGEVSLITLPGVMGPFQVLIHHAPIISQLEVGVILVREASGKEHLYTTSGGFAEMNHNRMTVIAETIEPVESIDTARAEQARTRALGRIHEIHHTHSKDIDLMRAEAALARAVNRLKTAARM